jgi:hypothetical protein
MYRVLEVPCTNVPSGVVFTVLRCRNVGNLSKGIMYLSVECHNSESGIFEILV